MSDRTFEYVMNILLVVLFTVIIVLAGAAAVGLWGVVLNGY